MQDENVYEILKEKIISNSPKVLFIGNEYSSIDDTILKLPWSCIITTVLDIPFHEKLANNNRRPKPIMNHRQAKEIILSTKYPCVVYLNNKFENNSIQDEFRKKQENASILNIINEQLIDTFGNIFICGYNPLNSNDINSEILYGALINLMHSSSFIFAEEINEIKNDRYLNNLITTGQMHIFSGSISANILNVLLDEDISYEIQNEESDSEIHLYVNKKRISINKSAIFETKGFAILLCEEEIKTIDIPSYLLFDYIEKFLQESARLPLWYGYAHNFNFRREFEDDLEKKIEEEFEKVSLLNNGRPVVLSGQTCSSKTIAVRAIAYKYFNEKKCPVVYISNPDINLNFNSTYFEALDLLLQTLEEKGAKKILLIWDNSSNVNQIEITRNLYNSAVRIKGRKIVLLTTAYAMETNRGFNVVRAKIDLSENEERELKKKLLSIKNVSESLYNGWSRINRSNLLVLLYQFFKEEISESIIKGVGTEVKFNVKEFSALFKNITDREEKQLTQMALALIKAGYEIDNNSENIENEENTNKAMKEFCITLAVFSEFNVQIPYVMALRCLKQDDIIDEKMAILIKQLFGISFIKLIPYELDGSTFDYLISFRTPLEAHLFLEGIHFSDEERINYITNTISNISLYDSNYKMNELSIIEKTIRIIGPNVKDVPGKQSVNQFLSYYPKIISSLKEVRINKKIYDPKLICQEVTLIREYYGTKNKNTEVANDIRLIKLREAIQISQEVINKVNSNSSRINENKYILDALVVESVHSQLELIELEKNIGKAKPQIRLNYDETYSELMDVIAHDPNNNYPYNALFRLFLAIYDSDAYDNIKKIEIASNILSLIDIVDSEYTEITENDFYIDNKASILRKLDFINYGKYFNELIDRGSASGIYLEAINMRRNAKIEWNEQLSEKQRVAAKEILEYLNNYNIVSENDNRCLYIKLNLNWLLFNKVPIFGEDHSFTKLSDSQWQIINKICSRAVKNISESGKNIVFGYEKSFFYILALSYAQLRNYVECNKIIHQIKHLSFNNYRLKTWHIICDNNIPRRFTGTVSSAGTRRNYKKYVEIREIGEKVYYHNLGISSDNITLTDIQLGLGFMGFEAFRDLSKENRGM
jgi:hypothetical protein